MKAMGLAIPDGYVQIGQFTRHSGYECARNLAKMPSPPTAIFCANDEMAIGASEALADLSVSVPKDISLIGFDDSDLGRLVRPALTSVAQPISEMATAAIKTVMAMIDGDMDLPGSVFSTTLVVRDSTSTVRPSLELDLL
jgi:DNA-binding LacI/PurR family transcriptional regulator